MTPINRMSPQQQGRKPLGRKVSVIPPTSNEVTPPKARKGAVTPNPRIGGWAVVSNDTPRQQGISTPVSQQPPQHARERLARRIREAAPDADRRYREHVYAVDERALHAAGWESDFGAPFSTPSNRGVGWCHPLYGWVWRTSTRSADWYAQPYGELFRFGPFPSIGDAIAALETTGGAA